MKFFSDAYDRYGTVSRVLHWLMAAGFAGVLFTSLALILAGEQEWAKGLRYQHKSLGFVLMVLIVIRIFWALLNAGKRPPAVSAAAHAGHLALYALMFAVPTIGLLRQYGAARGELEVFGLTVMEGAEEKIAWMADLGNRLHAPLAWLLFALAAGHIVMVVVHRLQGRDVLPRMWGCAQRHRTRRE